MNKESGITLVILVITIIILGIIASIVVVSSMDSINYTKRTAFMSEIKLMREKVNIANKEILIGSTAYEDVGKAIASLSSEEQLTINDLFAKYNILPEEQSKYKYFDSTELEKLGIYNTENIAVINFSNLDIISITGVKLDGTIYHTVKELEERGE